jgi:ABC-type glutathione transport system ATPase component
MSVTGLQTGTPAVALDGVTKSYGSGEGVVRALDDVSLSFEPGTFAAITGPSRSGFLADGRIVDELAAPRAEAVADRITEPGA